MGRQLIELVGTSTEAGAAEQMGQVRRGLVHLVSVGKFEADLSIPAQPRDGKASASIRAWRTSSKPRRTTARPRRHVRHQAGQ
jgi:hypothetical protein